MAILWCGNEDIDFPNGAACFFTNQLGFRSGFTRGSLYGVGSPSNPPFMTSVYFPGGNITSGWLSSQVYIPYGMDSGPIFGLGQSFSGNGLALTATVNVLNVTLNLCTVKEGNQYTTLLSSVPVAVVENLYKMDINVQNYGSDANINVYLNGALVISYNGNIIVGTGPGFNSIYLFYGQSDTPQGGGCQFSEVIVSDQNTISIQGLVTCAPNGNGNVQLWTDPSFTNVNAQVINDSNTIYTGNIGLDSQYTMSEIPAGNYVIEAVKVVARSAVLGNSTTSNIKLGLLNTTSNTVGLGNTLAVAGYFLPYEQYFTADPTSNTAFGSNLNNFQIDIRSE